MQLWLSALLAATLSACGGSGGRSAPGDNPAPNVSLSANPPSIGAGETTELTWSASNASSCTASGGWSGSKATSGNETVGPLTADTQFTLTCSGNGRSDSETVTVQVAGAPTLSFTLDSNTVRVGQATLAVWSSADATECTASGAWTGTRSPAGAEVVLVASDSSFTLTCEGPGGSVSKTVGVTAEPLPADTVLVQGRITFDRIPFASTVGQGLDPNNPIKSPARHVVVQALDGSTVLDQTVTDIDGQYALAVPTNTMVVVRARAEMVQSGSPSWNFRVLNNTGPGTNDPLYVLDSDPDDSGTKNTTRNLHAPTGWNGATYAGERAAAPFAILDTVFQAKRLILSAEPTATFSALNLFWSVDNRPAPTLCPDEGNIITTFYQGFDDVDDCSPRQPLPRGIYILGDFANGGGDTDEFDQHIIAHELGHYYEDRFSRSDSIGGPHSAGDRLDLRVAFGEGWGNAFSSMSVDDPVYRDSQLGVSDDFGFDAEADSDLAEGWFSESSITEILWDLYDSGSEPGDLVALGFGPIHKVMRTGQASTDAATSIYSFAAALREEVSAVAGAIDTLLENEGIFGSGEFGEGETNDGDDDLALPVYRDISLNTPLTDVCTHATGGSSNKLGNRSLLRFVNDAPRIVSIQATGAASRPGSLPAGDPDVFVHRRGVTLAAGLSTGQTEQLSAIQLAAGTYIIEVYDFEITGDDDPTPRCMTVSIAG